MRRATASLAALAAATLIAAAPPARADFVSTVLATNPLDFWTLDSTGANSLGIGTDYSSWQNGVGLGSAGSGLPQQQYAAVIPGQNVAFPPYISTGLSGDIPGSGTIMAWINLAALPSTAGSTFYIAGESQVGNDFDLQMETDNQIKLYTGSGENTAFAPSTTNLVGSWHQIVATYAGGAPGFRDIYWDGVLVANYLGGVNEASKISAFNIGYSTVFGGRDFDGMIADVGVWNTPLTGDQVSAIYDAANGAPPPPVGVPEPSSAAVLILAVLGLFGLRRRLA